MGQLPSSIEIKGQKNYKHKNGNNLLNTNPSERQILKDLIDKFIKYTKRKKKHSQNLGEQESWRPKLEPYLNDLNLYSFLESLYQNTYHKVTFYKSFKTQIIDLASAMALPGFSPGPLCQLLNSKIIEGRTGHVSAVTPDGSAILVWGGYGTSKKSGFNRYWPPNQVTVFRPETDVHWRVIETKGDVPPKTSGATAQIVGNNFYVLCGFVEEKSQTEEAQQPSSSDDSDSDDEEPWWDRVNYNTNDIYKLSLKSWTWNKLDPSGERPMECDKLVSWVHEGKIWLSCGFGPCQTRLINGFKNGVADGEGVRPAHCDLKFVWGNPQVEESRGWNNQLVAFDVEKDAWVWPSVRQRGSIVTPRAAHTAIARGHDVFLFGGRLSEKRLNDLYHLDMRTFTWTLLNQHVEQTSENSLMPSGRSWATLSLVSENEAILYGGYDVHRKPLNDCWKLSLTKDVTSNKWTRLSHMDAGPRLWHTSIYEKISGQVWILGGVVCDIMGTRYGDKIDMADQILTLRVGPKPLTSSCIDLVARAPERFKDDLPYLPREVLAAVRIQCERLKLDNERRRNSNQNGGSVSL